MMIVFLKIISRPIFSMQLLISLLRVRAHLNKGQVSKLLKSSVFTELIATQEDAKFADWFVRGVVSRFASSSPCLLHSITLYQLSPAGSVLRLSVMREEEITAHASMIYDGVEFSLAQSWKPESTFTEFQKES